MRSNAVSWGVRRKDERGSQRICRKAAATGDGGIVVMVPTTWGDETTTPPWPWSARSRSGELGVEVDSDLGREMVRTRKFVKIEEF
jgi:hypothetical protein